MQNKNDLQFDLQISSTELNLKLSAKERLKKGFELSDWSAKLNKNYNFLLAERLKSHYLLK